MLMFFIEYALPIAAALLLIVFFMGLPNLKRCELGSMPAVLPEPAKGESGLQSGLPIILITFIYSVTAFVNLGNMKSPESFVPMCNEAAEISLHGAAAPSRIVLYTGIGVGEYSIEYSEDGVNYAEAMTFSQSHGEVLKWHYLTAETELRPKHIRISVTSGQPWMGEIVFLDGDGQQIPYDTNLEQLCDEQQLCPSGMSFMNSSYFDEIYHARTAWEHLKGIWPYEISHPPLGKLIMSLGILLFGMTPFGWRFMGTVAGIVMLPVMYAFIKRLFGSRSVAVLGTIVFAADFMHFAQTRIATIDSYAVLFILLMYYYMYIYISEDSKKALGLSGIFFGLGAASKWTCLYAGAGLGVIWVIHWIYSIADAEKGESRKAQWNRLRDNVLYCLVFFVALPCLIYYLSYIPYGIAEGCVPFSMEYTRIVLDNQEFMFTYHVGVQAEHPYASRWYQWVLDIRPILYYLEYFPNGERSSISSFLNPALCWGGLISVFVLIYEALRRDDSKAGFIVLGYLAQLVPWLFIERLTFEYHYFACSVFLVLSLAYVFDLMRLNRSDWKRWAVSFTAVTVLLFIMFYPVLSGKAVDNETAGRLLGWLPTWPI